MEKASVEKKLLNFFVSREGAEIEGKLREVDLFEAGLLDSLDVIDLAMYLEIETGTKIDLTSEETFIAMRRYSSILKLIS